MYQLSLKLGCTQGTAELARKNYNFFPHSHSCLLLPDHLSTSHVIIYFCYHLFSHSPSTQRAQTPQRRQFWRSALSVRCLHWGLSITTPPGTKAEPAQLGCSSLRGSVQPQSHRILQAGKALQVQPSPKYPLPTKPYQKVPHDSFLEHKTPKWTQFLLGGCNVLHLMPSSSTSYKFLSINL